MNKEETMKIIHSMVLGAALATGVLVMPVLAEETAKTDMKHQATMCEKHCNLMELEKKVESLKAQAASESKTITKDHLKKDVEAYEKKLQDLKTELEGMK
jgi:hypothetical protein